MNFHLTSLEGTVLSSFPGGDLPDRGIEFATGEYGANFVRSAIREYTAAFSKPHPSKGKISPILIALEKFICDLGRAVARNAMDLRSKDYPVDELGQPLFIARMATTCLPLAKLLEREFGYDRRPVGNLDDHENFKSLDGLEGFASAFFWTEIASIIRRELKPDVGKMFELISTTQPHDIDTTVSDFDFFRAANPKRLFQGEYWDQSRFGAWHHVILRVHERDQPKFLDEARLGYMHPSSHQVKFVASCSITDLNQRLLNEARSQYVHVISDFFSKLESVKKSFSVGSEKKSQYKEYNQLFETDLISDNAQSGSVEERLKQLDRFTSEKPGQPISQYVVELFPELTEPKHRPPDLPKKAPERWPSDPDKRTENPAEFATRVYRTWMDAEVLTRPALGKLDPPLLASLDNWLKHNRRKATPDPLPGGFNLLTIEQANDAWIDRITAGREAPPTDMAGLARLAAAMRYRGETGR